jgi:hypothetical protein
MKTSLYIALLCLCCHQGISQPTGAWSEFYPYHAGDIRQYRSIFTGEITHTHYVDSVLVDSVRNEKWIFGRNIAGAEVPTEYRIDSLGNMYNMRYQSEYVRYKLNADSGDSWFAGSQPARVTLDYLYDAVLFGKVGRVKVYHFELWDSSSSSGFWIGNDHLAEGFGLVKEEIEPSDTYQLSGAFINGIQYGIIVSVKLHDQIRPSSGNILCYPNPFNSITNIRYEVPLSGPAEVCVVDILGRVVTILDSGRKEVGTYHVVFRAEGLASASYFVVSRTLSGTTIQRILLVK